MELPLTEMGKAKGTLGEEWKFSFRCVKIIIPIKNPKWRY